MVKIKLLCFSLFETASSLKLFLGLKQKKMVTTYNKGIYSSDVTEPATLSPCNHEEGDYRALLHCESMSKEGVNQAMIFTVDTNVVVIATLVISELSLLEVWIKFGKTANRKYLPIHGIVKSLGPERAACLTLFCSLTGCDEVSFFSSCGEKTAWKAWQNYPQLTESLVKLYNNPTVEVIKSEMNTNERFVYLMYDAALTKYEVNKCRHQLFTQYGQQLKNLTPTQVSLKQHILRAVYQAAFVWAQSMIPMQNLASPDEQGLGWNKEGSNFVLCWMMQPKVSEACKHL